VKRILVPCGSGVATSNMAAEKLKSLCRQRHMEPLDIVACDFKSLASMAGTADLIVTIAPYEKVDYGIPVLNGIPLLTGVGVEALMDQVEAALRTAKVRG
jgi:PTS system galactitol-specific IIB component